MLPVTLNVTSLYSIIPSDDGIDANDHLTEGCKSQDDRSVTSELISLVPTKNNFGLIKGMISKFWALPWVPVWIIVLPSYLWVSLRWIFLIPVMKHL